MTCLTEYNKPSMGNQMITALGELLKRYGDVITSESILSEDDHDYHDASILSRLIRIAGRCCEHYASDLFVDWEQIRNYLDEHLHTEFHYKTFFGFREWGVDHPTYIYHRLIAPEIYGSEVYRAIYQLDITGVETDHGYQLKYQMQRVRVKCHSKE